MEYFDILKCNTWVSNEKSACSQNFFREPKPSVYPPGTGIKIYPLKNGTNETVNGFSDISP
jgi:hypothetical protein